MLLESKLIILVVLIFLSAFFSGTETALFSLSDLKIKYLIKKKKRGAEAVERLKEKSHRLLTTILIGNNVVNIGASALAASIAFNIFPSYAISITTGIMTLIILVFGEITPKSLAIKYNEQISLIVARPLQFLQIIFFPAIILFEKFTDLLTRMMGYKKRPLVTEEELKTFITVAEEIGQIKAMEKEMIHRIFKFDDISVKEIMIPKNKMLCLSADRKIKEIAPVFYTKMRSKIPIYKTNPDNIKGFVHIWDLQKAISEEKQEKKASSIVKPILFVPDSIKLDSLLKLFQRKKKHIAIVRNKLGRNIGLVTLEDVLEEIVGEIIEEHERIKPKIRGRKK